MLPPPSASASFLTRLNHAHKIAQSTHGLGNGHTKFVRAETRTPRKYSTQPTLDPSLSPTRLKALFQHAEYASAASSTTSATGKGKEQSKFPDLGRLPEVVVIGRANSGKSSLLNAVLGRKDLVHTSSKPGRTRQLNFFRSTPSNIILVDAPGYGARGRASWGELFQEYVLERKELEKVYVLFNGKHHLNEFDDGMVKWLSSVQWEGGLQGDFGARKRWDLQAIITKADEMRDVSPRYNSSKAQAGAAAPSDAAHPTHLSALRSQIWSAAPSCLAPIVTSAKVGFGVEEVRRDLIMMTMATGDNKTL